MPHTEYRSSQITIKPLLFRNKRGGNTLLGNSGYPSASALPLSPGMTAPARNGICGRFTLLLMCFVLLMPSCAIQTGQSTKTPGFKYQADTEEKVTPPYTPRDDGQPLTSAELHAFRTVGELDRDLSQEDARTVELHFKHFVHQDRRTFSRFLQRSSRFLPHIKKVFTDRGIPEDVAYLVMVESGGNPNAISPAGATGLWQFMPYTGKRYGLKQNNWVDERRDPYKATLAAADYLLKLYNDFSNWHLAVAAYNAGEGKIGRALNGTGASDFFDLCRLDGQLEEKARLRDETRDYVPRLIAMAKIMRNLNRLDFDQPARDSAWDLTPMSVPPGTNLSGLAKQLGYSWEEFSGMNPAYRRTASPPDAASTAYVPHEKLSDAVRWVASTEARMYAGWKEYKVRKGDTLASIAKRNRTTVAAIKEANSISKLPRRGAAILIPGGAATRNAVAKSGSAAERKTASKPGASKLQASKVPTKASVQLSGKQTAKTPPAVYVVQPGDTLYGLAVKWGTDMDSIRSANKMDSKSTNLRLGQRLSVPANSKKPPATKAAPAKRRAGVKAPGRTTAAQPSPSGHVFEPARLVLGSYADASSAQQAETVVVPVHGRAPYFPEDGSQPQQTGISPDERVSHAGRPGMRTPQPMSTPREVAHATFRSELSMRHIMEASREAGHEASFHDEADMYSAEGRLQEQASDSVEVLLAETEDGEAEMTPLAALLQGNIFSSSSAGEGTSVLHEFFQGGMLVKDALLRFLVTEAMQL